MNLLTETHQELSSYLSQLENLKNKWTLLLKNFRPVLTARYFYQGKEVCELLHITKRTLQQYRDDGLFPYIQIGGKILFKQSDILKILEANYKKYALFYL